MFHDTNIDYGQYEPFLCKKLPAMNIDISNDYLLPVCKDIQNYWKSIVNELQLHQLDRPTPTISNCGDIILSTNCYLIETKFDVQSLRLCIVQTFFNVIMGK